MKILGTGSALRIDSNKRRPFAHYGHERCVDLLAHGHTQAALSNENLFDLACLASERALENAGVSAERAGSYNMLDRAGANG